jgi:hypothetical protein
VLGHIACRHGYHVRFTRADEMLRRLRQSRLDNSRDAEMIALTSVDLLVLDDFALEPMSKEESRDVYQLFLERTGRASMIVTSNRDTAEWLAMFDDVLLAQSAVDRFKERRLRLRDRRRVVSIETQAQDRRRRSAARFPRRKSAPPPARQSSPSALIVPRPFGAVAVCSCKSRARRRQKSPRKRSSTPRPTRATLQPWSFSPSLWRHHPAKQVAA